MVLVTKVGDTLIWSETDLSENAIKKVLMDFGLTEKETEIYIFLASHGTLRGGEISKRTKRHRGMYLPCLKIAGFLGFKRVDS